jgi:hypothetical protein
MKIRVRHECGQVIQIVLGKRAQVQTRGLESSHAVHRLITVAQRCPSQTAPRQSTTESITFAAARN